MNRPVGANTNREHRNLNFDVKLTDFQNSDDFKSLLLYVNENGKQSLTFNCSFVGAYHNKH